MFPRPFCCRAAAAMIPISLFTSLLSLQPLSLGNESQASLWVSLRACKFLGPIRTKKKKSQFFLSYPLSWPLGTNPKLRAILPSQAPRYQHPCASQGSLVAQAKQHLRDTLTSPDLPHATPLSPERSCFVVCRQHTRCSGDLLSHSRGYNEGWGWRCGICSPKEPLGGPLGSVWEEEKQDNKTLSCVPRESHPSPGPGVAGAETPLESG